MISIRNITKSFGKQLVLNNISLEIEHGEIVAIVGPSGVGKSVLLKLITGILTPDSGDIIIYGENITKAKTEFKKNQIRSNLGVLFQSAALFDSLNIYDNVAFPLNARTNLNEKQIHKRVLRMLRNLDIEKYALKTPGKVPMGIRKRAGMARALITEPKLILFDEPNTGLDPLVGQEVYNLIKECHQKWNFTGIVISHEIPEVFQVSNRVAMLLNGEILEDGTPDELLHSENEAVRQFLNGNTHGPIKIN
ncbi:MAG: ABC transporter ATP-binding protein [Bdellovibrionota bacterium]